MAPSPDAVTGITVAVDVRGIATVTLDRPDIHNAFDDAMIAALTGALHDLAADAAVRVVVLAASGRSFSAGANLNWMKRMAGYSEAQNVEDALGLARLMHTLYTFRKPTLARVHGPAFAGGLGLVACCDIAVAAPEATFCLTEVRLGMIPAVITPYVVVDAAALDARIDVLAGQLLLGGPCALAECKAWVAEAVGRPIDEALVAESARRIAALRASPEGREGVTAFLEKRAARWVAEAKR
jgi:methylglutaconyl-CoA hydratase